MVRKVVSSIIFVLVVVSFFYQTLYSKKAHPKEQNTIIPKEQQAQSESAIAAGVTPKPEMANENTPAPTEAKVEVDKEMFSIQDGDVVLGNKDAKVVVVEYSSLTCPHCSYFHKAVYPELKVKYIDSGKVAYILREFIANKQDLDGAILARCLEDKNDPLKLLNILYAQQDNWAFNKNYREILENIGQLAGISKEKYATCLARSEWVELLANQTRAITFYKEFVGTPAFFINGKMHKGIYDTATLSQSIDDALAAEAK